MQVLHRTESEILEAKDVAAEWIRAAQFVTSALVRQTQRQAVGPAAIAASEQAPVLRDHIIKNAMMALLQPDSMLTYALAGGIPEKPFQLAPILPRDAAVTMPGSALNRFAANPQPGDIYYDNSSNVIAFAGKQRVSELGKGVLLLSMAFHAKGHADGRYTSGARFTDPARFWREAVDRHEFEFGILEGLDLRWMGIVQAFNEALKSENAPDMLLEHPQGVVQRKHKAILRDMFGRINQREEDLWGGLASRMAVYQILADRHGSYTKARPAFGAFLEQQEV